MDRKCIECKYCRHNLYDTYVCLMARKLVVDKNTPACCDFKEKESNTNARNN